VNFDLRLCWGRGAFLRRAHGRQQTRNHCQNFPEHSGIVTAKKLQIEDLRLQIFTGSNPQSEI
jgi:hypothetical protein